MGSFTLSSNLYIPFLIFFSFHLPQTTYAQIDSNITDRSALLSFKSLIYNDPYRVLSSWNDTVHHCKWPGVKCGRRHPERVTSLVLESFHLSGYISPSLANLTFLRNLTLYDNLFSGAIPEEIGRCSRLRYLSLNKNSLEGEIPNTLSNCSNLEALLLSINKLQGTIPSSLGNLTSLNLLGLYKNNIHGEIPSSFGGLQSIKVLSCGFNQLSGEIPTILGQLRFLELLLLEFNILSGKIPHSIYNLSAMRNFELGNNQLEGTFPSEMCDNFSNLEFFYVYTNNLTGQIRSSISNCSALTDLELGSNSFTGTIPSSIGNLKNLYWFDIGENQIEARTPGEWSFMDALSNCTFLKTLSLGGNQFQGLIPNSLYNLSTSLYVLDLSNNPISGSISADVGRLTNLSYIVMGGMHIGGSIPIEISNLPNLQWLDLSNNMISGEIPSKFGNLTQMNKLFLDHNMLRGTIPPELSNMQSLEFISFSNNKLIGEIPKEIMNIHSLSYYLDLSNNDLNGSLPLEIGKLKSITSINLSRNRITGEIPNTIDGCQLLQTLDLHGNLFQGSIPSSFGNLQGLKLLDLSNNSLAGQVPEFLSTMDLQYLNLSFNDFEGELPDQGAFKNITAIDVRGNSKLCGGVLEMHLPKCISMTSRPRHHFKRIMVIILSIGGVLICLFIITMLLTGQRRRRNKKNSEVVGLTPQYKQVSYDQIFTATDGFSLDNLIGTGSFGVVYKAVMSFENMTTVAVKVLNLEQRGASRSFLSECEALRNIKHRNLIKVLSSCSSIDNRGNDFKALIFEFMANGSLETWLHPTHINQPFRSLSIIQRMNIAYDVAIALEYLHHHGSIPIIHCDLKPSNILLDDDMIAHVGDFGLAKFLIPPDNVFSQPIASSGGIKGSIGYIPPEYGMGVKASELGDMYSYGILLLEMFTGISPTDDQFKDGLSLHSFVEMYFPDKVMDIIDTKFVYINDEENNGHMSESVYDCLVLVLRCGLSCSKESPQERARIKEVLKGLNSARKMLLRLEI